MGTRKKRAAHGRPESYETAAPVGARARPTGRCENNVSQQKHLTSRPQRQVSFLASNNVSWIRQIWDETRGSGPAARLIGLFGVAPPESLMDALFSDGPCLLLSPEPPGSPVLQVGEG